MWLLCNCGHMYLRWRCSLFSQSDEEQVCSKLSNYSAILEPCSVQAVSFFMSHPTLDPAPALLCLDVHVHLTFKYWDSELLVFNHGQTQCCSCSIGLQEAYMLLSRTSMNRRDETEWSKDIISIKNDRVLLKLLFYVKYECASLSFIFWSSGSQSKLRSVALSTQFDITKSSIVTIIRHHQPWP